MNFSLIHLVFVISFVFGFHIPYEYPVAIPEIGDIVVTAPIISAPPKGSVILPFPARQPNLKNPYSFSNIPSIEHFPLDSVLRIFDCEYLTKFQETRCFGSKLEEHMFESLKFHLNHFNPSLIEGIDDSFRILAFAVPFLKLFKVAYPGLFRVKLEKSEIVTLTYIASGLFLGDDGEEADQYKIFSKYLQFYNPAGKGLTGYNFDLYHVKAFCAIAYQAVLNLHKYDIYIRNVHLFKDLSVVESSYKFLHYKEDWKTFDETMAIIKNVNEVYNDCSHCKVNHVLLEMIICGHFNEEIMLRPELKEFAISESIRAYHEDFYSEALYFAIEYQNCAAIRFLLNLDYKDFYGNANMVEPEKIESVEDDEDDSSLMTVSTPWSWLHPDPIDEKTFYTLKGILETKTMAELMKIEPKIQNFAFHNFKFSYLFNVLRGCSKPISKSEKKRKFEQVEA